MADPPLDLAASYWQNLSIQPDDLEVLSTHLLEVETPLSPEELVSQLIVERLRRESERQSDQLDGEVYLPQNRYKLDQKLIFPALDEHSGSVVNIRPADSLNRQDFEVIEVEFSDGVKREFASSLAEHVLNVAKEDEEIDPANSTAVVLGTHAKSLIEKLEASLRENEDFVYIAGRWFPKALIVDVSEGQLNVAEAQLDMAGGGPLPTAQLLGEVELPEGINPKLAAFSLDLALQEDERFDEVGPAGLVGWYLHRLEPDDVRHTPVYLRYKGFEHDRSTLTEDMLDLERRLDDELSPLTIQDDSVVDSVEVRLIFPHWRAGTFPLTDRMARLFPTAYESPRVKFVFVDAESGERFPGWVVLFERYVFGLREWYERRGLMPGSYVHARRGEPGEIIVEADEHRASKEWVRTALIGAEGGVVYAMLKQTVEASFDERMMVFMPSETQPLEETWQRSQGKPLSLRQAVTEALGELAKLNPQNHVHASELYAAVNVVMRCPPAPIFALLASDPEFTHVGDLHFQLAEAQID